MPSILGVVFLVVSAALAQTAEKEAPENPAFKPFRISPRKAVKPKVGPNLLRRGTTVVVHAIISKTGAVTGIQFVKGNLDLMPEALKAIKNWKYKPYVYQGKPVEVETTITISFDPWSGG